MQRLGAGLSSTTKDTNPKDAIGGDKVPVHLWPDTATIMGCMALLEGACKYGRSNWREAGVRASIYYDALRRHLAKWWEGEEFDGQFLDELFPDDPKHGSGLPHEAHMLACIAIIVDAKAHDKFIDDRAYVPERGFLAMIEELAPLVASIKARYADRNPKHYSRLLDEQAREQLHQEREQAAPAEAALREDQQPVSAGDGGSLVLGSDVRLMDGVQMDRVPAELDVHFSGFEPDAATLAQRAA